MYNAPRAATIIAKTDVIAFALDRECFNHVVKDAATKKREAYEKFLSKVELLDQMDPYERSKIADALKPMKFKKGDFVVKEVGFIYLFFEENFSMFSLIIFNFLKIPRVKKETHSSLLKMARQLHRKFLRLAVHLR